jgi:hypothetical protein
VSTPNAQSNILWLVVCTCLGFVGLFALAIPLFGFLSYIGALAFPVVVIAEIALGLAAVVEGGRWRGVYVGGNLGLVVGNGVTLALFLVALLPQGGRQPDTDFWRPVYFGVVLAGLAAGVILGMRLRLDARRS